MGENNSITMLQRRRVAEKGEVIVDATFEQMHIELFSHNVMCIKDVSSVARSVDDAFKRI